MKKDQPRNNRQNTAVPSIKKTPKKDYYPVSLQQEGVWLQSQIDPASTVWNTSHSWRYQGSLDIPALKKALRELIHRHASLRTHFQLNADNIIQVIQENFSLNDFFRFFDISSCPANQAENIASSIEETAVKEPYNLATGPLFRFTLIRLAQHEHVLVIGKHHIISDVTSRQIIWKEWVSLYNTYITNNPTQPGSIDIQYHDYATWQQEFRQTPYYQKQKKYWLSQLSGKESTPLPVLNLPTDLPRRENDNKNAKTSTYSLQLDQPLAIDLRSFSLQNRVTFSAVFLSAFYILLHKYTGQDDIVIGTLYRGRNTDKQALDKIIGLFANHVATRLHIDENATIKELLAEVNKKTRQAYENQDYLYEDLLRTLHPERTALHAPIYRAVFNMLKVTGMGADPEGLVRKEWQEFAPDSDISTQYDLSLYVRDEIKKIKLMILYTQDRFLEETIKRTMLQYHNILLKMILQPRKKLKDVEIITKEEKQRILDEFNDTGAEYPRNKTLHQLFAEQAKQTPDQIALVGPHESRFEGTRGLAPLSALVSITYRQLNQKSQQLALLLKEKGVKPDTIVGIMIERSIDMIIGIFAILKAGGAYLPIDPQYPPERIDFMLKDSSTEILLKDNDFTPGAFNNCPKDTSSHLHPAPAPATSLAYIIYTSGSTGKPKGVPVRHLAVINVLSALAGKYPPSPGDTYLLKTPYTFDVSVTELFGWFWGGGRVAVLEKDAEKEPQKILTAIEQASITHVNFVPSMFTVFLEILKPHHTRKLSYLKYIFLAGEALLPGLVEKFIRLNSKIILENLYGPTETTIYASQYSLSQWNGSSAIPIGKPLANLRFYILDRCDYLQPLGVVGELCISGTGLAQGYLNRPELTAGRFCRRRPGALFEKTAPGPRKNFLLKIPIKRIHMAYMSHIYKTGDLARWLPDGNIEFLGRIDNQVKIRGNRIELGEIEAQLNQHPGIKESVVTTTTTESTGKNLCAYLVGEDTLTITKLREYLAKQLPDYMVPAYFVKLDQLPLTANGKIDRKALPVPGPGTSIQTGTAYEAPRDDTEKALAAVWQEVLGITIVGIHDNFFANGGDSIKAIQIASRLTAHGYRLEIGHILRHVTIKEAATYIESPPREPAKINRHSSAAEGDPAGDLDPSELNAIYDCFDHSNVDKIYDLSPMQQGMLFHYLIDPRHQAYLVQMVYLLAGNIDTDRFAGSCQGVVDKYDVLRTAFVYKDVKKPHQVVLKHRKTGFRFHDITPSPDPGTSWKNIKNQEREKGFDLNRDILIRFTLTRTQKDRYTLLFTFHHIILDGWSTNLVLKDLVTLYSHLQNNTPWASQPAHSYRDYIRWLNKQDKKAAHDFWQHYLQGFEQVTRIPPDKHINDIDAIEYNKQDYALEIPKEITGKISHLSHQWNVTPNNILQTVWCVILQRCTATTDIVFGNVISGRNFLITGIEQIIGLFLNTIPIRITLENHHTLKKITCKIKENLLDIQQYGYLALGEIQGKAPLTGQLLEHLYIFENHPVEKKLRSSDLAQKVGFKIIKVYNDEHTNYHLDIKIIPGQTLRIIFQYNENVYTPASISRLAGYMKRVIHQVLLDPAIVLSHLEIITPEEKHRLLLDFNQTALDYPHEKTLHRLFQEQTAHTPDHIALIASTRIKNRAYMTHMSYMTYISYRELNEKSQQLALLLKEKGVKPDTIVGLMVERSAAMMIGIFGILKAGGAYLPIDPQYPEERINYMLTDSNTKFLVTTPGLSGKFKKLLIVNCQLLMVNEEPPGCPGFNNPPPEANSIYNYQLTIDNLQLARINLAYVIYTSGSTGKPKGVMLQHQAVHNFIAGVTERIDFAPTKTILALTTISFDIFVLETLLPLSRGLRVALAHENLQIDLTRLEEFIVKNRVNMIQTTPTRMQMFTLHAHSRGTSCLQNLTEIMIGGEPLPQKLLEELKPLTSAKIYNMYGPTETTVWSTIKELTRETTITIGQPIANTQIYILDKNHLPQPIGIVGNLYIGGHGLARGYTNRPELTAEKFCLRRPGGLFLKKPPREASGLPHKNFPLNRSYRSHSSYISYLSYIYQTGDLARWLPHGNIECLGRIDSQVKIRGHRIEPGEIEACLNQHRAVKESLVVIDTGQSTGKNLGAYVVSAETLSTGELRNYLQKKLPEYMIPAYFVQIEKIPLTPNGKVDRKSLPKPDQSLAVTTGYVPPDSEIEKQLLEIWQELLNVKKIGINDNFFELGGHSLVVMNMVLRIQTAFAVEIPMIEIFNNPTAAQIAQQIQNRQEKINRFEQILTEIESLDEKQIAKLLIEQ